MSHTNVFVKVTPIVKTDEHRMFCIRQVRVNKQEQQKEMVSCNTISCVEPAAPFQKNQLSSFTDTHMA